MNMGDTVIFLNFLLSLQLGLFVRIERLLNGEDQQVYVESTIFKGVYESLLGGQIFRANQPF